MAKSDMYRRLQPQYAGTREIAEITNNILNGKLNCTGEVTLNTGNATTTTIYNERIGFNSQIILVPLTISSASTGYQLPHGLFEDDSTQTFTADTPTVIDITDAEKEYGMSLASNQITVDYAGCYDVDLLCRFNNTDSQIHNAYVWFRVNGTDVPHSCTNITIPDKQGSVNGAAVAYVKHPLDLDASDYVEAVCAVDDAVVSLTASAAITSPYNRPSIPSVSLTLCMAFPSQTSGTGLQPYISDRQKGQATVTHLPNSVSNNTWGYVIIG